MSLRGVVRGVSAPTRPCGHTAWSIGRTGSSCGVRRVTRTARSDSNLAPNRRGRRLPGGGRRRSQSALDFDFARRATTKRARSPCRRAAARRRQRRFRSATPWPDEDGACFDARARCATKTAPIWPTARVPRRRRRLFAPRGGWRGAIDRHRAPVRLSGFASATSSPTSASSFSAPCRATRDARAAVECPPWLPGGDRACRRRGRR